MEYNILSKINNLGDLKKLEITELKILANELRDFIVDTCSKNGGHLASNLGVVELTIALLKLYNPPEDKIIWDVGHQSYSYKILTDRKEKFCTIRTHDGISGFPKISESCYDSFGTGHASTSLSSAL